MTNSVKVYIVPNVGAGFEGAKWPPLSTLTPISYTDFFDNFHLSATDGVVIEERGKAIYCTGPMLLEKGSEYYRSNLLKHIVMGETLST